MRIYRVDLNFYDFILQIQANLHAAFSLKALIIPAKSWNVKYSLSYITKFVFTILHY